MAGEHTFLFADLCGFTALTEAHGDEESAELTNRFFGCVRSLLDEHDGEEIKTIGDAVMARASSATDAVRLGRRIVEEVGAQHGFPSIRVGMHTGPATQRDGDWFGATVNTAARVSAIATEGEVLVTAATKEAAQPDESLEFQERGRHELKNVVGPVAIYAALPTGSPPAGQLPIDPVCRMAVSRRRAAGQITHDGVDYYFCSLDCARAFTARPEQYVGDRNEPFAGPPRPPVAALIQGASYVGFGLWSLLGRRHYRATHKLDSDDWVLNAHGAWLLAVGSTLLAASLRREADRPAIRFLGSGSALGLAVNDAVSLRTVASIYRVDLAYELALVGLWAASSLRPSTSMERKPNA